MAILLFRLRQGEKNLDVIIRLNVDFYVILFA
ncbi:hypothetical protein NIES2109_03840 [Nostoc sp. HK-01]|nr:hypothetical protein NIES2109_03840 [Nostoc sp. HK-01]